MMFRYPFVAAKLLGSKSTLIKDFFFKVVTIKDGETDDILDQFEADVLLVEEDKEVSVGFIG